MKVNMHTSHPSAFISSTFIDLYTDRAKVAETLKARGLNVNALDIRPASNQSSKTEILNGIKESDFVILIIGDRYGSILNSMTGNDYQSITWWEYASALKMGKHVIVYFKKVDKAAHNSHDDKSDSLYQKKRHYFEIFKSIVTNRHNPSFYKDESELATQLDESLINIYRAGVKELSVKNSTLNIKIEQLESELASLKSVQSSPNSNILNNPLNGLLNIGLENYQNSILNSQPPTIADDLNKK